MHTCDTQVTATHSTLPSPPPPSAASIHRSIHRPHTNAHATRPGRQSSDLTGAPSNSSPIPRRARPSASPPAPLHIGSLHAPHSTHGLSTPHTAHVTQLHVRIARSCPPEPGLTDMSRPGKDGTLDVSFRPPSLGRHLDLAFLYHEGDAGDNRQANQHADYDSDDRSCR